MKTTYNNNRIELPDFLITGAMRSGTTSLYNYLLGHNEIFMPSLKEPHFFSYYGDQISPHPPEINEKPWTLSDYCKLFTGAKNNQKTGEASISYLYIYEKTIKNILKFYGDSAKHIKIIGLLRNPIDRAWSIYSLKRQGGTWKNNFVSYINQFNKEGNKHQYYNFLASGLYYKQVKTYQRTFPFTKFFLFDELINDPEHIVRTCLEFIDVEDVYIPRKVGKIYNYSGIPKNKALNIFYYLLFSRYNIKNKIKHLIPENKRLEIKRKLGSYFTKKEKLNPEINMYLKRFFKEDLIRLSGLLKEENQKEIIRGWIS